MRALRGTVAACHGAKTMARSSRPNSANPPVNNKHAAVTGHSVLPCSGVCVGAQARTHAVIGNHPPVAGWTGACLQQIGSELLVAAQSFLLADPLSRLCS